MEILAKFMPLESGEEVVCNLEGKAYNISHNVFVRIAAFFERIISILVGSPRKAHVIVTNRRVILVETKRFLWFFIGSVNARSVMPRSIGSMGYQFARSFIFFKSHYLEFTSGGVAMLVKSKSGKDRVYEMIKCIVNLAEKITTK